MWIAPTAALIEQEADQLLFNAVVGLGLTRLVWVN